ncbi:MAG: epoxyqueuosine reductase [Thermoguttaceae bacterium]
MPLSPFYLDLEEKAFSLGLSALGVAASGAARTFDLFAQCVVKGQCADLTYLTNDVQLRRSPTSVLPDARSVVVVALSERTVKEESRDATAEIYASPELQSSKENAAVGRVSGYATCLDYHELLKKKLRALSQYLKAQFPDASIRAAVDTAPILEKDWACEAGIGFVGLHSLVVHPKLGSRFFLGELLVSVDFEKLTGVPDRDAYLSALNLRRREQGEPLFDAAGSAARCLRCRRCVDACPTGALVGNRTLDARRCLNYWTIETINAIPEDIAVNLDGRLFGCDLCQRVCPHNAAIEIAPPRLIPLDSVERLDDAAFRRLFKKTPVFRAHLEGLQRVAQTLMAQNASSKKK